MVGSHCFSLPCSLLPTRMRCDFLPHPPGLRHQPSFQAVLMVACARIVRHDLQTGLSMKELGKRDHRTYRRVGTKAIRRMRESSTTRRGNRGEGEKDCEKTHASSETSNHRSQLSWPHSVSRDAMGSARGEESAMAAVPLSSVVVEDPRSHSDRSSMSESSAGTDGEAAARCSISATDGIFLSCV